MDNTYEWELSKENIQPLKHGRNVTNLVSALTTNEDHVKQQRHEQKKWVFVFTFFCCDVQL